MTGEDDQNRKVLDQLALMNKLLSVLVSFNMEDAGMTVAEEVQIMDRAGLTPSEIAAILGTSPHSVSAALYKSRKKPAEHAQKDSS